MYECQTSQINEEYAHSTKESLMILFRQGPDGSSGDDFGDENSDLGDLIDQPFESTDPNAILSDDEEVCSHESHELVSADESDDSTQLPDSITYSIKVPDPLCVKMNDLLSRGLIPSDGILYKHLNDVVECIYNPLHSYHPDVIEFFNTLQHLGGQSTVNFVRGPMFTGKGRGIKDRNRTDCKMNMAGPSAPTRRKKQSGYTTKSGIIKELSLAHYKLTSYKETNETFLVFNDLVQVTPCVLSNDGNPLKPAIEFDQHYKRNIGLDVVADYEFVHNNPTPSSEFLKEHLVTEVVISSLTSLNNKTSIPTIAEYVPKTGKTGNNLSKSFIQNIIALQVCESCQKMTKDHEHIMPYENIYCKSTCKECLDQEKVCEECQKIGHRHYLPCLRACDNCLDSKHMCIRRVVLVLCSDCEEGNKKAFKIIIEMISKGTIDPNLALLTILPDTIHVGKSLKQGFANWMLIFGNERGFLGILRALRSRASLHVSKKMHKILPKADHVVNRDRMDPGAVIAITKKDVTTYLSTLGYVSVTIIPEICKYTDDNRVGFYQKPVDVCVALGMIFALFNYNNETGKADLLSARLHSPVDQVKVLRRNLDASQICFDDGVVYLCGKGTKIRVVEITKEKIHVTSKNRTKKGYADMLKRFGLPEYGTAVEKKIRLEKYISRLKKEYECKGNDTEILQVNEGYLFESICPISNKMLMAASSSENSILKFNLSFDGVGVGVSSISHCCDYKDTWKHVRSICFAKESIYICHNNGVSKAGLEKDTFVLHLVIENNQSFNGYRLCEYKQGILITDVVNRRIWYYSSIDESQYSVFAGNGELIHKEGPAKDASFIKPCGLAVEFDNIVYVCDIDANRINIITSLDGTCNFLREVGNLYSAFSVHEKGSEFTLKNIDEAIMLVKSCLDTLKRNEEDIRRLAQIDLPATLNGSHGYVASKTVTSTAIVLSGLRRLKQVLEEFNYKDLNLMSCLTIDVEHFHAATHMKSVTMSMQQYCFQFGSTLRESIKRITNWGAHYYTGSASWYPTPDCAPKLEDVPMMIKGLPVKLDLTKVEEMRSWAHIFGRAVRQKTNRQQTTMASAGTMPCYVYDRMEQQNENTVNLLDDEDNTEDGGSDKNDEDDYDSESTNNDDDITFSDEDIGSEELPNVGVTKETIFLIGGRSRYGRSVRLNSKFL